MIISGFTRMKHPLYSPDFAPCNFVLFGSRKGKLKDIAFSDEEEFSNAIRSVITAIPGDRLLSVSSQWVKQIRDYIDTNCEYIE
jgi:hypothetical protein